MAVEWRSRRIGDLGKVITGKTPSTKVPENFGGPYPFIMIPDMDGRREISQSERSLSEIGATSLRTCRLPAGAVMMSCIATIGRCGITTRPSFTNQQINSLICGPEADPAFVYYSFTQLGQALEAAGGGGSVYTNVSKSRFENIEIPLPPLPEQKAIARILGTLDDKIELNRRMNATLEAMARALFQSWFVDFDPVHAKAAGREPSGMDPATAALFPASFQDSELGQIPEAWKVEPLSRHLNVVKGRSYKSGELADSKTALVTLKSFQRGGGYRSDGLKAYTGDYKPDQRISPGDLVVAYTDVTQAAEVIGKPAIVRSDSSYETLVASLDVGIIRPLSERVSIPFLYCLFLTGRFQAHTYAHATGTTVLHLSTKAVQNYVSCIPPQPIAEAFAKITNPLFQFIDQNEQQSRTLATLRDTLLPKLLSGDLSVATARATMEASS